MYVYIVFLQLLLYFLVNAHLSKQLCNVWIVIIKLIVFHIKVHRVLLDLRLYIIMDIKNILIYMILIQEVIK